MTTLGTAKEREKYTELFVGLPFLPSIQKGKDKATPSWDLLLKKHLGLVIKAIMIVEKSGWSSELEWLLNNACPLHV